MIGGESRRLHVRRSNGEIVQIEERLDWRRWVTPTLLRDAPVHRWFVFPHSYTGDLVETLLKEWNVALGACVLDPFAGAGTTAVAARAAGMRAVAFDLSPLSVLATRVKTAPLKGIGFVADVESGQEVVGRTSASQGPGIPRVGPAGSSWETPSGMPYN